MKTNTKKTIFIIVIILAILGFGFKTFQSMPDSEKVNVESITSSNSAALEEEKKQEEKKALEEQSHRTRHIKTPKEVRGIYITSWVSSQIPWRTKLVQTAIQASINAVVIDVKDCTGYISFDTKNEEIKKLKTEELRIRDLKEWIEALHEQNIYVIARITVFQDPLYTKIYPESAIHTKSGAVWRDRKGLAFIDPTYKPYWSYLVALSKACEEVGFDELNYDYIRYPTDGNLKDMVFEGSDKETNPSGNSTVKSRRLKKFFAYLRHETRGLRIPISADVFGMTLTNKDDLGIGQQLDMLVPYFDYICPMIYPSHWPKGFINIPNPAAHPYPVIYHSVKIGLDRMPNKKMRPWIQAFDLGAVYNAERMSEQKRGLYDLGVKSWLLWDPANRYRNMEAEPLVTTKSR